MNNHNRPEWPKWTGMGWSSNRMFFYLPYRWGKRTRMFPAETKQNWLPCLHLLRCGNAQPLFHMIYAAKWYVIYTPLETKINGLKRCRICKWGETNARFKFWFLATTFFSVSANPHRRTPESASWKITRSLPPFSLSPLPAILSLPLYIWNISWSLLSLPILSPLP